MDQPQGTALDKQPLADLSRQFDFNTGFLTQLTQDWSDEDWNHHADGMTNTGHWIVGHLAHTRRWMLRLLYQITEEEPWEAHFTIGAPPDGPCEDVPVDMLINAFREAGKTLGEALSTTAPEKAQSPLPAPLTDGFPDGGKTIESGARFLFFHEAYHLGQIGLLRRCAGKTGLS